MTIMTNNTYTSRQNILPMHMDFQFQRNIHQITYYIHRWRIAIPEGSNKKKRQIFRVWENDFDQMPIFISKVLVH